jgi:hypothetical protein
MASETSLMFAGITYSTIVAVVMMCCGIYMRRWMMDASDLLTYPTGFMNQVAVEWQTQPLVSIVATNNTFCPTSNPQLVIGRHFYGTDIGCDCLGIYSQYITGDNSMVYGAECSYNQTRYGCDQAYSINPIR